MRPNRGWWALAHKQISQRKRRAGSIPPTSLGEPASSSSAAAPPEQAASRRAGSLSHAESAASSSAAAVPDQAMSGEASSSSNTGVERPNADCSHSDSETKRCHGDHFTSDVVMFISDSDVGQSVSQWWSVGRQRGVFLVDVNDWHSASRNSLRALGSDGAVVTCNCRMGRDSLIFLRPPEVVTGAWRSG